MPQDETPLLPPVGPWPGQAPGASWSSSTPKSYWHIAGIDPPKKRKIEYLPAANDDEFLSAGKIDFHNRYPSSVMLTTRDVWEGAKCSAVLLTPRIALTAGHCVCERKRSSSPGEEDRTFIDASSCAKRTYVTTVFYGEIANERQADTEFLSYAGEIYPHPELQIVLDEQSNVLTNHADLAIIALQAPVPREFMNAPLGQSEVQTKEALVMSGFGSGERFGQLVGIRYFRKNQVTLVPGDGRVLYAQQGTYLYNGFDGGPCFREDERGRWLVGIASLGTEQELAFTSTFFYRDWIQSEIARLLKTAVSIPH